METISIRLTGCTIEDGPELAYNNISAFWQNAYYTASWRHTTLEKQIEAVAKRVPRNLLNDRETLRHQKAVDATGKIIGYARWILPKSLAVVNGAYAWPEAMVPAVTPEEEAEIRRIAETADWKPTNDKDDTELDDKVKANRERLLSEHQYIELDYLAVHPDQQGKGIAFALVTSGLEQAKKLGLDILVLAFPSGFRLYEKLNFRVLETIRARDEFYGGNYTVKFMTSAPTT